MFDKPSATVPPVGNWFDVITPADVNVSYGFDNITFEYNEIVLPSGVASKLRIYISDFVADRSVEVGLYQSDLLVAKVGIVVDQLGYCEGNISTPVIAGTYQLVYIGRDTRTTDAAIGVQSPSGQTGFFGVTGTPNTIPNPLFGGGSAGFALGLGVFVT